LFLLRALFVCKLSQQSEENCFEKQDSRVALIFRTKPVVSVRVNRVQDFEHFSFKVFVADNKGVRTVQLR